LLARTDIPCAIWSWGAVSEEYVRFVIGYGLLV